MREAKEKSKIYIILGIISLGAILFSGCAEETKEPVSANITEEKISENITEEEIGENITEEEIGGNITEETVSGGITPSENVSEPHWSYEGESGPENWAVIGYPDCAGKEQSPVDIPGGTPIHTKNISFNYNPSVLEISNNGHTIKVTDRNNSVLIAGNNTYKLEQYHLHAPSEHTINMTYYDMELHLVHKSDAGKYAVVGVMITSGSENKAYAQIWEHLPAKIGEPENISSVKIDANDILPKNLSYYQYNGSFTTPPCTEGVNWFVLSTPVELSEEQIQAFEDIYSGNYRPVQPLNQRKFI